MIWFRSQIVAQFREHGLVNRAAALTYTTLFAVVPLTTVAFAILSVLPEFAGVGERVQSYLFQNFVPESSSLVREKLAEFSEQARQLSWWGTALLVVTAFLMLVTVEKTFNDIWKVTEHRRGLQRFLVYWAVLTCGPLLVVGGLLISSYLFSLPFVADIDSIGAREKLLGYLPVMLNSAAFTVLYSAVPNCHVPLFHAFLGGLFSMGVLEAAKAAFTWYVGKAGIALIYGTFAAVPLFLAWVYLFWVFVLSGAMFGAAGFVAPRHMEAIAKTGGNLVAAVDPSDSVGVLDSYFPECRYFRELERFERFCDHYMEQTGPIDYVVVCSPNYLHDAHCAFGLRMGANVICEKPVTVRMRNLWRIRDLQSETGRSVHVMYQLRCSEQVKDLLHKYQGDGRFHKVEVDYGGKRVHWYEASWKGQIERQLPCCSL